MLEHSRRSLCAAAGGFLLAPLASTAFAQAKITPGAASALIVVDDPTQPGPSLIICPSDGGKRPTVKLTYGTQILWPNLRAGHRQRSMRLATCGLPGDRWQQPQKNMPEGRRQAHTVERFAQGPGEDTRLAPLIGGGLHNQAVEILGDLDLARQARRRLYLKGKVEHILFFA